eukprot:6781867-Karenia_brevis.AAC.1
MLKLNLYAMAEGVNSTAAKSFVCRRGFKKKGHLELRDLWLQKEVRDGHFHVSSKFQVFKTQRIKRPRL